jgi:dTDP-L-rhamnose 4-epimerase
MQKKVLVTGGAGFIGSFIVDKLVNEGHDVRVLDSLEPQVHPEGKWPSYINLKAEYIKGDVRDAEALKHALEDVEIIFHKAAAVGVGQSMYQIHKYMDVNTLGTARLLDTVVNGNYPIKKIIVASSMSIYGEGEYMDEDTGAIAYPMLRQEQHLKEGQFEHLGPTGKPLIPIPTKETKPLQSTSIYAISKKDQEEMTLTIGRTYGIPSVALRYFNVFGPRQSLSNPYTGVAAVFMNHIKNDKQPEIFEDGMQSRDLVSVHDIAQANLKAMRNASANFEAFNIGSGRQLTITEVAKILAQLYGKEHIRPRITGKYRAGDIRHCFADISKARGKLEFEPETGFDDGMRELMEWAKTQKVADMVGKATDELKSKGLVK